MNRPSAGAGRKKGENRKSFLRKIMATAGTLSGLALMPAAAQAGVVDVSGSPISLSLSDPAGTTVTWDVDGADGADFELWRGGSTVFLASRTSGYAALNGRGLIAPFSTDNVQALGASFQVGPTLAISYVWGPGSYRYRNALQSGPVIGYDFNYGFAAGDNFFGFRFVDAGDAMHYGFGVINFDLSGAGIVTISRWAYETTPDTAIHVQDIGDAAIPEPGTSALMLLGLGASGLLAWRNRRKKRAGPAS